MTETPLEQRDAIIAPREIKEQLDRLLSSAHFSHSRRYPNFLRHVVSQTLDGRQDDLKERSIGIDVFQRTPSYDLNLDPVVRVTAGEVRKRLAQYYYEPEHRNELRIEMRPGSYIPEFRAAPQDLLPPAEPAEEIVRVEALSPLASQPLTAQVLTSQPTAMAVSLEQTAAAITLDPSQRWPHRPARRGARLWLPLFSAGCLLAAALLLLSIRLSAHRSMPFDSFWQPMLTNANPVLICVGSWGNDISPAVSQVSIGSHAIAANPIALADTLTSGRLQQVLSEYGKQSTIQSAGQTTFSDLQRGPSIIISAFDNQWTLRLTDPLRFHFVIMPNEVFAIEDRNNPTKTDWRIDSRMPYANLHRDFGILARFHDPTTDQTILVVAGVGENGTIAVGEMLTDAAIFAKAEQSWPLLKSTRNLEAVVETQVIDGKPGPPRIVALNTW